MPLRLDLAAGGCRRYRLSGAGSTLIVSASNARPKIADTFTTSSRIWVWCAWDDGSRCDADAVSSRALGAGLGHRFLRHIERTRVLIHLVDCSPSTGMDPADEYGIIRRELSSYGPAVAALPEIIALNKIDIPEARERAQQALEELPLRYPDIGERGCVIRLSGTATGEGVKQLVWDAAKRLRDTPREPAAAPEGVVRIEGPEAPWTIKRGSSGEFVVQGRQPERLVAMTDLGNEESLSRLQMRMGRMGILKELRRMGVKEGNTVRVGEFEFDWFDEEKQDGAWAERTGGED